MNGAKGSVVNMVMMTVIGLLAGLIAGYMLGRGEQPEVSGITQLQSSATTNCEHELDSKDAYIISGFRCPGSVETQSPLLTCHCVSAHGIKDRVKAALAEGTSGEQIRQDLIAEYGDQLKFAGQ